MSAGRPKVEEGIDRTRDPAARARLRHCMVVYATYPLAETRVQREAEALADAGFEVDVLCLRGEGERPRERHSGVEIHRLPVRRDKRNLALQFVSYLRFLSRATARLTKLHLRRPYDSVQVHNLPDFLVFCALVPKLQGVPVILDLHDLMPEFFAGRFGRERRWLEAPIRLQERMACRFADHVITVSEHWRRTLIERGVSEHKCSVVMNVADERVFVRPPTPPRPGPEFRLIYHGTVTRRYGLDLAIRAVGLVAEEIPQIRLTILGRGDDMDALRDLRRELELQAQVELRDEYVLAEDLPDIIALADIGIAPYRNDVFTDGLLPTKLMEYAVLGLPCIAARTTAIDTYFTDTMVEFFTPGDAEDMARCIRALWLGPERRAELARRSEAFTQRYNWDQVGAGYVSLVSRLASPSSARTKMGGMHR